MNEDQAAKYFEEALELDRELLLDASKYLSEIEMNGYISWFHVSQEKFLGSSKNISLSGNMAYDNALFYKGFLMQEVSKIKNLSQHDTLSTLLYDNLKALRHQLAGEYSKPLAEQSNIIELEENAQIAEKELVKNVANLDQTLKQFKWTDIKNSLQPREAAIEFIAYRDNDKVLNDMVYYEALLITAKSEKVERIFLFEESELEGIFENSQESTASINRLYSNKLKDGKEKTLANLVYSPLQNHLMNVETIYYSVEGLLHKLNFDAIQLESNILLGEKYMLNRLGSTKHITSLKSNESISVSSASLFGGISYDLNIQTTEYFKEIPEQSNQTQKSIQVEQSILRSMRSGIDVSNVDTLNFSKTWQELKWTAVEIEAIELILEDLDIPVTTYTSSFATEDNFKSCSSTSSPNILHVATHGFFFNNKLDEKKSTNNQEPIFRRSQNNMIRSGLILAGGNYCWKHGLAYDGAAEDGILTSYEISNLDFQNTDLVVLSACETGLGIIKDNEGVYGLQRAFKIAGANYIIMSLWQVPDFQSQELMTSFYYHWLEGKNSIPTAFRLAQQELKSKGHSTFDWAGFILIQ